MNRFGAGPVVHPFVWQPTRGGLRGLGTATSSVYSGPPVGQGAGGGAITGAEQGAAAGSVAGPIGTAIGAVAGAIGGAIAGAINKPDAEVANFNQAVALWQVNPNNVYNIADKYLVLAGLFDLNLKNPQIPIYRKYGRMGEQKFTTDLVNLIYQAAQQGKITGNDSALTIMSRIVQPWIDSWGYGPMVDPHADLIQRLIVGMISDYVTGNQTLWRATGGDYPFGNLPVFSLPAAAAPTAAAPPAATFPVVSPASGVSPVGSAATPAPTVPGYLMAGTPGTLLTPQGSWQLTADGTYLLNGAPSGAYTPANRRVVGGSTGTVGLFFPGGSGGQTYAYNNDGASYVWGGAGWNATTQVPVPPAVFGFASPSPVAATPPLTSPPPAAVAPVGSATIPQVTTSSPSTTVGTTTSGATVTQADLQALIAQLANQGQSAQQAYTSALQTLQANGVQSTPAVQSAVQQAVQATPAPMAGTTAGLSGVGWAGVIAVGALLLATARPVGKPTRRKHR